MGSKPKAQVRRPPAPADVERFVQGAAERPDVQTPERPGVQVPERPDASTPERPDVPHGKGMVQRKDGTVRRRATIYLTPETARALAVHCAGAGVEMSEVVEAALAAYLKGR